MKILRIIPVIVFSAFVASASIAFAAHDDYYANYYEDEGDLLFKIRGFYLNTLSKPKNFPASVATKEKPGTLVQVGYGVDTATTYFFTDNIAAELSLGIGIMRVKSSSLSKAALSLGDGTGVAGKNNQIIIVPAAGTIQYHVAPFGAIRPYVGGGIHGTYMYTRSKAIKVSTGYGPVAQIGVDFISKDDTLFTFDIRKYFLKSNVTFKKGFLGPNNAAVTDVRSKVDWSPLVISAGFGFRF
jgi:outer membrane protein